MPETQDENAALIFPSQLFENDGSGVFTDVARQAGVANMRYCKGSAWGDYDNDGDQDLYVSNYAYENRLYRNDGDGTFTDVAPELGVTEPVESFPTWFWDYDNDGWLDLFVAGYARDIDSVAADYMGLPSDGARPRLYRNTGAGQRLQQGNDSRTSPAGGPRRRQPGHGSQLRGLRQRRLPRPVPRHRLSGVQRAGAERGLSQRVRATRSPT